jgi:acetyl-CoA synthetase
MAGTGAQQFLAARDLLLELRGDPAQACERFRWPALGAFNWAIDYFDTLAGSAHPALRVVDGKSDRSVTFTELATRSNQVANYLASRGVVRGERILLMVGNVPALWETLLGAMKVGAVVIPATTLLSREDLVDRLERGKVRVIVAEHTLAPRFAGLPGTPIRISVGGATPSWIDYTSITTGSTSLARPPTIRAEDPVLLYFTSGTTAKPKLVLHTHASYPVGHLTTMYWLGVRPGDVHLNLSSPGWAKHAWSSVFAPWNAGATILTYQYERFQATQLLDLLVRCKVTTFCAPPTVWRMLIQQPLKKWKVDLREVLSAGEPCNPEIIAQVDAAWGLTIRDGYGQTETTLVAGNMPGAPVRPGSMGRPAPGYSVALLDAQGQPAEEGELCLDIAERPLGLMVGYMDDTQKARLAPDARYYHTGDVASRDSDGYLTYVGRADDVFKSSDYRISPFELESILIEHTAVAEAAVVPSPDPVRLAVPKAFVTLRSGNAPTAATAASILAYVQRRVSSFKRVRRIEFADLPKTISGKIRRVELRAREVDRPPKEPRRPQEFWEEDLPAGASGRPD